MLFCLAFPPLILETKKPLNTNCWLFARFHVCVSMFICMNSISITISRNMDHIFINKEKEKPKIKIRKFGFLCTQVVTCVLLNVLVILKF